MEGRFRSTGWAVTTLSWPRRAASAAQPNLRAWPGLRVIRRRGSPPDPRDPHILSDREVRDLAGQCAPDYPVTRPRQPGCTSAVVVQRQRYGEHYEADRDDHRGDRLTGEHDRDHGRSMTQPREPAKQRRCPRQAARPG
jgi:hypothetical protein